jgi:fluoride exporter
VIGALAWAGVAVFGALGALARFRVDQRVSARWPSDFPLGTLAVNLTGSFALGVLVGVSLPGRPLLVFGTGFLGGYTTFSTWMVESERLAEDGELWFMWINLFGSLGLGVLAAGLGWLAGGALR